MASHTPSTCCTIGVKHDGEPTGTLSKVDNIEVYVAEPKGKTQHNDAAILYLPDVIGIWQNSKLMADQFAANGYYTVVLDIFNGDALALNRPPSFDLQKWIAHGTDNDNPHTTEAIDPIIEKAITHLHNKCFKRIGATGYCFGAKYVIRFMAKGKGIDVGYLAHPSFVEESEVEAITGPLTIAAAQTDKIFTVEKRHKTEEILANSNLRYQINLYGGVAHGFAVRCDVSKKHEKYAKEQAFYQAVAWFDEHLI